MKDKKEINYILNFEKKKSKALTFMCRRREYNPLAPLWTEFFSISSRATEQNFKEVEAKVKKKGYMQKRFTKFLYFGRTMVGG